MFLRVLAKTIFPVFVMGVALTLLSDQALAHSRHWGGDCGGSTGGTGGGVPEIGAGSAAAGLALVMGTATLVKDWISRARGKTNRE